MSDRGAAGGSKRENGGYLFQNTRKTNPNQPDWRGKANINGKEMLVSGWNRDTPDGQMISFQLTDPATLPQRPGGQQGQQAQGGYNGGQGGSRPQGGSQQGNRQAPPPAQPMPDLDSSVLDDLDDLFKQ
jgi:hypothetical protein